MKKELTAAESNFLANTTVVRNLHLQRIATLQVGIEKSSLKRFTTTLELAKVVDNALTWWKTDTAKQVAKIAGIKWSLAEFSENVLGFKASFMYKLVKASKIDEPTVNAYIASTNNTTLEDLLKFVRPAKDENAPQDVRAKVVLSVNMKRADSEVKLTIDSEGNCKTSATFDDVEATINLLQQTLKNLYEAEQVKAMDAVTPSKKVA